jgi:RimJ/RimL family protein N-acetyltransferase
VISFDPSWGPTIARRVGTHFNPDCDKVVCRLKDQDTLMGGSLFCHYTTESISIHVAAWLPNWLTRELLFVTFGYPFLQLPCNRVFSQIPASNTESLRFNLHLGFREVARIKGLYAGGDDCIVTCMEKNDCRFLARPRLFTEQLLAVGG